MIRHDRSVIDTYGGIWPGIADKVRDHAASTEESEDDRRARWLRERRQALGLSQERLVELCGPGYYHTQISAVERNIMRRPAEWWVRIEAALAAAEAEK